MVDDGDEPTEGSLASLYRSHHSALSLTYHASDRANQGSSAELSLAVSALACHCKRTDPGSSRDTLILRVCAAAA